jgi:hypothetical protein
MKKKGLNHIFVIATALLILVLSACSQNLAPAADSREEFIVGAKTIAPQTQVSYDALLAELTTPTGSILSFIDEGKTIDGAGIGVLEVGENFSLAGLERYQPTALELFMTFAPKHAKVPARLLEEHAKIDSIRSDVSEQPRNFTSEIASQGVVDSLGTNWCRDAATFKDMFHNWFYSGLGYAYEGYGLDILWNNYGVTGKSNRRALAACNKPLHTSFATSTPVKVQIESQLGENFWPLVPGTLKTLDNGQGMYYFSEGWTSQRYRIVANGHNWAIYSLAGAWGKK